MNTRDLIAIASLLVLTGCAADTGTGGPAAEQPTAAATTSAAPSATTGEEPTATTSAAPTATTSEEPTVTTDPALNDLVARARRDLADRLGVDPEAITVVSAETVVWPDASLGCPQPGMRYAQVIVDGALIRLEAGGRVYPYHTGGTRAEPFLCEQTGKPPRVTPDPRLTPRLTPSPDPGT